MYSLDIYDFQLPYLNNNQLLQLKEKIEIFIEI